VAPLNHFAAIDVPRQVDEKVPAETCWLSSVPRFSGVTRFLTKVMPCSIQGLSAASFGSKSMMVMCWGSTLMCFSRVGSVHLATAPKPTNKTRFGNASMLHLQESSATMAPMLIASAMNANLSQHGATKIAAKRWWLS
jgi:hypothetical protein